MSFSSGRNISNNVNTDEAQTLTNKTIDSANNSLVVDADTATVSNIEADNLKAGVIDDDLSSTSVNDDTVPSAKAAKAYTDAAASTASSNLTTHETSTTGVHGVTGDIVGTSDTQTLTNKTITGADIRTPARADVKQDTRANLEVYATTASDGQVVFATDEKKYFGVKDNALVSLGGGLGSPQTVAVVTADDAQNASDFSGNDSDLTVGSPAALDGTLTQSETAADLLTGVDKVFKYVAGATSQFDFFGYDLAIPQGFAGRTLAVELTYRTDATYSNGDFSVEILSNNGVTTSYLNNKVNLLDSKVSADGNGETVRYLVNVPADCETLKVAFQNLSATSGIEFYVDKISVDIDDFNYKNVESSYTYFITQAGNAVTNQTLELEYNLVTADIEDQSSGNITAEDDSANTRTKFIFNANGSADVFYSFYTAGVDEPWIYHYDSAGTLKKKYEGTQDGSANMISVNVKIAEVVAGDFITVGSTVGVRNTSNKAMVSISLKTASKHVVVDSGEADTENYIARGWSSWGSSATMIPVFTTEIKNETGQLIEVTNDSVNGLQIKALQDVFVNATYSLRSPTGNGMDRGWSLNASSTSTVVQLLPGNEVVGYSSNSSITGENVQTATTANITLKAGDILRPHTNASGTPGSTASPRVSITAQKATKGEYHLVPVSDQENVYSARYSIAGATTNNPTEISKSSDWITSFAYSSDRRYRLDFSKMGVTEFPVILANIKFNNGSVNQVEPIKISDTVVEFLVSPSDNTNYEISIIAQKQGADYNEPKAFIGNVATDYFQRKNLQADTTSTGILSDLSFSNLVVGRAYRVEYGFYFTKLTGLNNDMNFEIDIDNGTTLLARVKRTFSAIQDTVSTRMGSLTFVATDTSLTFDATTLTRTQLNSANNITYVILTELNHTRETTRF